MASAAKPRREPDSDEDYDEGFEDAANNDGDEMERIKRAMAKEKAKAERMDISRPTQKDEKLNPLTKPSAH